MAIVDVCRLCLATDDLVYIFNEENKKLKMNDVISITTGIEIHTKDIISQKVCDKCYQFTIKVFQFRGQCLKADKYFKGLCMDYLVDKKYYIPNTEVSIKGVVKSEQTRNSKSVSLPPQRTYKVHPSVVSLSRAYPEMKLPKICLTSNVTPFVEMELNQVENHFKRLKLDFNSYVKNALVSSQKYFRKNKALPTNIDTGKIDGDKAIKQETFYGKKTNEIEICVSPNRSRARGNNSKSPVRTGIKRKLIESSPKEKVDETLYRNEHCDANSPNLPNKKKQMVRKSLQKIPDLNKVEQIKEFLIESVKKRIKLSDGIQSKEKSDDKRTCLVKTQKECFSCSPKERRKSLAVENSFKGRSNDEQTSDDVHKNLRKPHPIKKFTELTEEKHLPTEMPENPESRVTDLGSNINDLLICQQEIQNDDKNDSESLTNVGRSVPLFVCEICNSVQYNMHDLKKHKMKHMRCQFCKIRLRTLENKKHHIENVCMIKKMIQNLPQVELVKVEYNKTIRSRYPETFAGFSPLPLTDQSIMAGKDVPNLKKVLFKDFPPERLDIIEILSDDNDPSLQSIERKLLPLLVDISSSDVLAKVDLSTSAEEVVKNVRTAFQIYSEEGGTQTDLPSDKDVTLSENGRTILKKLQPHLSIYPIMIKLLPGQFHVSFDYEPNSSTVKELSFWDDLIPADIIQRPENCDLSSVVIETETLNGNTQDETKLAELKK